MRTHSQRLRIGDRWGRDSPQTRLLHSRIVNIRPQVASSTAKTISPTKNTFSSILLLNTSHATLHIEINNWMDAIITRPFGYCPPSHSSRWRTRPCSMINATTERSKDPINAVCSPSDVPNDGCAFIGRGPGPGSNDCFIQVVSLCMCLQRGRIAVHLRGKKIDRKCCTEIWLSFNLAWGQKEIGIKVLGGTQVKLWSHWFSYFRLTAFVRRVSLYQRYLRAPEPSSLQGGHTMFNVLFVKGC